jgi:hypothetical protein
LSVFSLQLLFANNASTTLATGITAASTSLQVVSGTGSLFPNPGAAQGFFATLIKSGSPTVKERILVTARSTDNFTTIFRGQDSSTALTWNAGDTVEMRPNAANFQNFAQFTQLQAQAGNFAADTGAANAYVVNLSPALNGHVIGMPIRWVAGHTNTATESTFNDGFGVGNLFTPQRQLIQPGMIIAGGTYETIWNGTDYSLHNVTTVGFAQVLGTIANAQVPVGAVTQWETSLVIPFSQLTSKPTTLGGYGITDAITAALAASTYATLASFANSLSGNGFQKLSGGGILQWGLCNPNGGSVTVTFPTAFPTAAFIALAVGISTPTQSNITSLGASSMTVANTGGQSYWIAVGH